MKTEQNTHNITAEYEDEFGGEFLFVDHGINLHQTISQYICENFHQQLPDLSNVIIFVPAPDLIYTFRKSLLSELSVNNQTAFIGAEISPIKKWVEQNVSLSDNNKSFINNHNRQLIILQALQAYPAHFKDENLWQVSASLLQFFDELTLNNLELLNLDKNQWLEKLQLLYGIQNRTEHLSSEANLIHTLWNAWQQQLCDDNLIDASTTYIQRLQSACKDDFKDAFFIIAGAEKLTANEAAFIKKLSINNQVRYFIQANPENINTTEHPDNFVLKLTESLQFKQTYYKEQTNLNNVIHCAFHHETSLYERKNLVQAHTIPNTGLKVFTASSEEHEAAAIDLQVRQWLLDGKRNIAIITENRKLARRVRALLERSGVNLVDSVGWSLSTTSAASVLERWLECIEQDFAASCFLDFLKSPYLNKFDDENKLFDHIFRFEQDIIIRENISGNLERYIHNLQLRKKRLTHWENDCYQKIHVLLNKIGNIAAPIIKLFTNNQKISASNYLHALSISLEENQLTSAFADDEAGELILAEITHMINACQTSDPEMNWYDFRTWLASALENHHYSPSSQSSHVRLLNLKQSNSGFYEGLILASADASQLPGSAPKTPFFNHHVKQSLELPDWKEEKAEKYYLFRRLIQSAEHVVISYCEEKNNEIQQPSPWLQTIIDFYQLTDTETLFDHELNKYLSSDRTSVLASTDIQLPEKSKLNSPSINQENIPNVFSSSRHQRLINCPYQFYANDVLKLRATEEIITELQKSEYGQKVHSILETYHLKNKTSATTSFEQSLNQLRDISQKVFKQDIEDNFLHRGWLKRWFDHCENYLHWQNKRQQDWQFKSAEEKITKTISDGIVIEGRLDRIDQSGSELAIVDYKTSSKTPSQTDVLTGEDIQLSSYALLLDNVNQTEYLRLDETNGKVSSGARLESDDIEEITSQTSDRFIKLLKQIENAAPLISNGDDDTCRFCSVSGLCRKDFWKLEQ